MAIRIKTDEQIEKMRVAGQILARLDEILRAEIKPGVTTKYLDAIAEVAAEIGYIKPEDVARLIAFRNNPSDESWIGAQK